MKEDTKRPPPCPLCGSDAYSRDDDDRREPPGATPQGAEPQVEQPPEPFDCALIVRCAKWCGKEKCRDHDAIAHAELVKVARETVRRHNEWAAQMPAGGFNDPLSDAIAALRASLPPEGTT